jgi:xylulokinase
VKAIAADDDGNVVARARIAHDFSVPSPQRFEHDAKVAWHAGPLRALEALGAVKPRAVSVAAMVPSLTAVDDAGIPCTPGLLYGDERGHQPERSAQPEQGELMQFLKWQAAERPDARGYWMAQAVANNALTGDPGISMIVAATAAPLFDWTGWDADLVSSCNARVEQLPALNPPGEALGEVVGHPGCVLEGGTIDAFAEQLVADAGEPGDVLVILGTTLIVWAVVPAEIDIPNYYAIPNMTGGTFLVGGPRPPGAARRSRSHPRCCGRASSRARVDRVRNPAHDRREPGSGPPHRRDRWRDAARGLGRSVGRLHRAPGSRV